MFFKNIQGVPKKLPTFKTEVTPDTLGKKMLSLDVFGMTKDVIIYLYENVFACQDRGNLNKKHKIKCKISSYRIFIRIDRDCLAFWFYIWSLIGNC